MDFPQTIRDHAQKAMASTVLAIDELQGLARIYLDHFAQKGPPGWDTRMLLQGDSKTFGTLPKNKANPWQFVKRTAQEAFKSVVSQPKHSSFVLQYSLFSLRSLSFLSFLHSCLLLPFFCVFLFFSSIRYTLQHGAIPLLYYQSFAAGKG